jgi:hypothetical protein
MLVSAKLRAYSSARVCDQENQGSEIGTAYPSAGCSTVAVSWVKKGPDPSRRIYVLPANRHSIREPTRGLEALTWSLLTSARSVVAEHCRGLQIPHRKGLFCSVIARYCRVLRAG